MKSVRYHVYSQQMKNVYDQIWNQVGSWLWAWDHHIENQVRDQISVQVRDQISVQVYDQVEHEIS
jgi:hypothetical protein